MSENKVHPRVPLSERICERLCLFFALWTLCTYSVVAVGGTLHELMLLFAVCSFAAYRYLALPARAAAPEAQRERRESSAGSPSAAPRRPSAFSVLALCAVTVAVVAAVIARRDVVFSWYVAIGLLILGAVWCWLREDHEYAPARAGRSPERLLWVLTAVSSVVALIAHRPDADDSQYVNFAVAAIDLHSWPLLSGDTMHGIPGLPLILPVYQLHTYELFNAAIAAVTRLPAIVCFHLIATAVAAFFVPLAHAHLLRLLTPRVWVWSTAILVFVLLAAGETHRWHGNFSLVRIWQGKAIMLYVFVPLIYSFSLRFGRSPSWRGAILLGSALIAALGFSSTALWLGPVSAGLAFASAWQPSLRRISIAASAAVLSAGIAAIALFLTVGQRLKERLQSMSLRQLSRAEEIPGERLAEALHTALGDGRLFFVSLAAALIAWLCVPAGLARKFCLTLPLGVFLVLLNPWLSQWISAHVVGPSYWRGLWALPLPLLITLVIMAPMTLGAARLDRRLAGGLTLTACLVFALVPRYHGLSAANGTRIDWPGLKVPHPEYEVARAMARAVSPRAVVIAPEDVDAWLTTLHEHPYPIQVRRALTARHLREYLGTHEVWHRDFLSVFVNGYTLGLADSAERFREGLRRFPIEAVGLRETRFAGLIREILVDESFAMVEQIGGYEIWVRSVEPRP